MDKEVLKPPKSPVGGLLERLIRIYFLKKYLNNLANQTPFPFGEGMGMGLITTNTV
jgi:hypothetical protein